MAEDAPSLRVWLYPLLAASILVGWFLFYTYSSDGPYGQVVSQSKKNLKNALIELTRDTSDLSIVIVGSSLTEHAFADVKEAEDSIFRHTNKRTKLLRVCFNFMDMALANRVDFFNYISNYPPDYLFLESFSFNIDHVDSASHISPPVDAALLQIRNSIRGSLGAGMKENYYVKWFTFDLKPTSEFYSDDFDSATFKYLQNKKKCVARELAQNSIANRAYAGLTKSNTKVVFLDMPQSNKLPYNFLDPEETSDLDEVLKLYKKEYNVDYWPFPSVMDDKCFTDGIHLNYKGTIQFQKWFVSEFPSIR
jgi:hypothetical protein